MLNLPFCIRERKASRGSSLSQITARWRPSGNSVGTSFMLWTARSASPLRSASSISFTKSPLPPTCASGTSRILSPVVLILLRSTSRPGFILCSSDFTHSACQSASLLPRVPMMTLFFITLYRLHSFQRPLFYLFLTHTGNKILAHNNYGQPEAARLRLALIQSPRGLLLVLL